MFRISSVALLNVRQSTTASRSRQSWYLNTITFSTQKVHEKYMQTERTLHVRYAGPCAAESIEKHRYSTSASIHSMTSNMHMDMTVQGGILLPAIRAACFLLNTIHPGTGDRSRIEILSSFRPSQPHRKERIRAIIFYIIPHWHLLRTDDWEVAVNGEVKARWLLQEEYQIWRCSTLQSAHPLSTPPTCTHQSKNGLALSTAILYLPLTQESMKVFHSKERKNKATYI